MPPPPPPPPAPPPPPPAPAGKSNKTLFIVLGILLGLFLIVGGCVATCTYVVGKKAKEYSKEAGKNPQFAAISLAASLNPAIEVVSKDPATGIITIKDKESGKIQQIDTNKYSGENIGKAMEDFSKQIQALPPIKTTNDSAASSAAEEKSTSDDSSTRKSEPTISAGRAAALTSATKKLPSFVAVYPGSTTTDCASSTIGTATLGTYEFTTRDSPEKVGAFYEKKVADAGLQVAGNTVGADDNGPTITLMAQNEAGKSLGVVIAIEEGKTKAKLTFVSK
jgi:hypothetical protein